LPFGALVAVLLAAGLWWTALERQPTAAIAPPHVIEGIADAGVDAPVDAAIDAPVDAFDLRGDSVELPGGVRFIVPPRLHHEWVTKNKRTLAFGDGDHVLAIVNVTQGKALRGLLAPQAGAKEVARSEKLEVTSIETYAPDRVHAQLDGERKGVQIQQHLIFITLPTARVTIWVQLSGTIILDPRLGELLQELRTHRVVIDR
jgi:hypothetical protein